MSCEICAEQFRNLSEEGRYEVWSDLSRSPPRVDRANRHSAQVKMIAGQLEQAGFEDEVRVLSKFRHPNVPLAFA